MTRTDKRCVRCAISEGFPRIQFDSDGVCSFCRDLAFYAADEAEMEQFRARVKELFDGRPKSNTYDALVCLSGGKDSTCTLMLTVQKYGLKTLAFTLDNGFLSEFALENIQRAVDNVGVDHVMVRPALDTMKAIVRASALHQIYAPRSLTRISAICNSCITMVNTMAVSVALEKSVPFIIAGFTLGQIPSNSVVYRPNYRFIQESRSRVIEDLAKYSGKDISNYFSVRDELLDLPSPWHVNLLCLETMTENQIIEKVKEIGWRQPTDVDGCSSNCRLNAFNNYVHEKAYGYNPYELELSHLVRKGLLTRSEALDKLDNKAAEQLDSLFSELGIKPSEVEAVSLETPLQGPNQRERKTDGQE